MEEVLNCRDMPMDYDDSEFSIHNVELTEEESSTVSPVLRPYDYEDGGHLSFDSLVENEVFLGITGQEDNQWIEEYSRGTSSSVVESRRDNVWSEAASSESVEMLLKSVGQGTFVTESSDEPGRFSMNLDPNFKQEDDHNHSLEAMLTNKEEGVGATEELDVSDEPGSFSVNLDPNLKQEDGNNHSLEAMLTNKEEGVLANEELDVSDEPVSLLVNLEPNLKQEDENNHGLEAMVTHKEEERALASEEFDLSDGPSSLATNLDPNLKQVDENNLVQEAMVTDKEEEGVLVTEELDVSDEPCSLIINTDPNLKQDGENILAHEALVIDKEMGPLVTEELDASDEPGSIASNMDPTLNQDGENNHAPEAMLTNKEDLDVGDEPGCLSTNMNPSLKQDDENNRALEALVSNKEEGVLATEELDVSEEPGSLSINLDFNLKQDGENNHALEAMVTNKEEEEVLTTEELDMSDEPGSLSVNLGPKHDENNHALEALVTNKEEEGVLATEELDVSDEPGSLTTNMDPNMKQDDENNHALEAIVTNMEEEGVLATEELDVRDEPGSLVINMDHVQEAMVIDKDAGGLVTEELNAGDESTNMISSLKQDDGNNHAQEPMVTDKEVGALVTPLVTEELDASDDPGKLTSNMDPNLKQDDGNRHAHEGMIINKPREGFGCDGFHVTVTKDSQKEMKVSGGELDSDVLGDICDLSEEKVDGICDDVNHDARNIAVELSENKLQEDLSVSKIECGNLDASKECDFEKCPSSNEAECSTKNTDNPVGSHTAVNNDETPSSVHSLDKPPIAVDILVDEESMPAESCQLLMTEACTEVSHDSKCAVTEACELTNDLMHEDLLVAVEDCDKTTSDNFAYLESNVCSPSKVSDAHVEESEKPDSGFDPIEMGEGSSINDTGTNLTNTCSSDELIAGNTDLVATPKVHSENLNKDQSSAAQLSDSVQQQVSDEIPSSEQDGGTCIDHNVTFNEEGNARVPVDMDIAALDSQQNDESFSSDEGFKAQGSEADMTIFAEPGYVDAKSPPILGEGSSVHHDNKEKKEEGYASDGTCENESLKLASGMVDCASLSVVETVASPDSAGEAAHETSVENMNAVMSDLAEEANPDGLGACSTPLTVDPIPCNSSAKVDDNIEAEGCMQESISEHDNMPIEQPASTDVVPTLECSDSHKRHDEDTFVSMDKLESVSPLLNTDNTELSQNTKVKPSEGAIDENTSFSEATEDVKPGEGAIDENTSLPEATEDVKPTIGEITSFPEATKDVVLTSECDDSHIMHDDEDSVVSMDRLESVSSLLNTNNTALSQSTSVINENTSLPEAAEDVVLTSECDHGQMRHEDDTSVARVKSSEGAINENTSLLISECDDSHMRHDEESSVSMDKLSEGVTNENPSLPDATEEEQGKEQSVSLNSNTKIDKSFTFEVSASATAGLTETCKGLQLFPASQACNLSTAMEVPCIDSSNSTLDPRKPNEASVTPQTPGSGAIHAGPKERRTRRKSVGKESVKKGKETTTTRSGRVEKSSPLLIATPPQPAAAGQVIQFQEARPKEKVECSVTKPIAISNLPDLNNAASVFYQPFTNNQQVQLRAQILVYGSLISGMPPEEPHMIAAFGQSDAGRKTWEDAWRACLERAHGQKSLANTPMQQPRADLKDATYRSPDLGIKHTSILSSTYKGTPTAVSPLIPVSSPLWNMSSPSCVGLQSRHAAFQHPFTPIHHPSYQTPHNPLWLSQSPFLGQWGIASLPGSVTPRFSGLPITEAVKLTPVNVSGGPHTYSLFSPLSTDCKKVSSDQKSRKRKTVSAVVSSVPSQVLMTPRTGAHNRIPFLVENQTDSVTAPVVTGIFSTSVTVSAPSASKTSSPGFLTVHDMLKKAEECNLQEANANATDSKSIKWTKITTSPAVNQTPVITQNQTVSVTAFPTSVTMSAPVSITSYSSQNMNNALAVEETLSKVKESKLQAENAALLAAAEVSNCQNVWSGFDSQNNTGVVFNTEAKLMSSIAAAVSVAKMASAAAKIASNVAEQAKLMADEVFPSSKTENINHISHSNGINKATPASFLKSVDKATDNHPNSIICAAREAARRRIEAASAASKHAENLDAIVKAAELAAEAVSQVGKIAAMDNSSALRKFSEAGPEGFWKIPQLSYEQHLNSNSGKKNAADKLVTSNENDTHVVGNMIPQNTSGVWEEHNIKEGCLVEVFKEDGKYKGAWLAANVLSFKDEKALICYTGVQSLDEGSENLKEWVSFEVEDSEKKPRIRIAHPMTTMRFEGARKRRRTAVTDYVWSKGDKVDVWMQDCWREGIVMEPNKLDATALTVRFPPSEGETSVVRSWHVRPTLIWKDGKWIESNGVHTSQGELPKEKRMKLGSPIIVNDKRKDKLPMIVESGTHEEQGTLLPLLSSQETRFNAGKTTNKPSNNLPTIHKDKARVVFGVPKPGRKQKFMAVSTQYVDDRTDKKNPTNRLNSSLKFSKPSGSNQVAETKSRLKPRKPPVPWFRTTTKRDPEPTESDSIENSSHRNQTQVGSSSNKKKDPPKGGPTRKAFTFTSKPKSEPIFNRGKLQAATKSEVKEKSDSEVKEPRRSNRKIQPTSRLLEGLQSSLTVSKIPSVSHAAQRKVAPKGNT